MSVSVLTLLKIESGDQGVAIALYATALWLIGRDGAIAELAQAQFDVNALNNASDKLAN